MSRKYYNPPPDWDIPAFLKKHYLNSHIKKMIEWSNQEYNDAIRNAAERGAFRFVKLLNEEYSPMRILAESECFREIIEILKGMQAIDLSPRERSFVRRSYQLFLALS